jgi:hypothetical protein
MSIEPISKVNDAVYACTAAAQVHSSGLQVKSKFDDQITSKTGVVVARYA